MGVRRGQNKCGCYLTCLVESASGLQTLQGSPGCARFQFHVMSTDTVAAQNLPPALPVRMAYLGRGLPWASQRGTPCRTAPGNLTRAWCLPCRLPELRRTASWSTRDAYTDGHVTSGPGAEGGGLRTRAATQRAHGFRRFHPGAGWRATLQQPGRRVRGRAGAP